MSSTPHLDAGPFPLAPATARAGATARVGHGRWARRATSVVLAFAIGLAVVVAVAAAFGIRTEVVLTGSMRPAIAPNDMLIVNHIQAREMQVGDIVSFAAPGQTGIVMTHRVRHLGTTADGRIAVTTRGDANNTPERWTIARDGSVARVMTVLPGLGVLTQWTGDPVTRTMVFGLIGLLGLLVGLRWVWRRE